MKFHVFQLVNIIFNLLRKVQKLSNEAPLHINKL